MPFEVTTIDGLPGIVVDDTHYVLFMVHEGTPLFVWRFKKFDDDRWWVDSTKLNYLPENKQKLYRPAVEALYEHVKQSGELPMTPYPLYMMVSNRP